MDSLLTDDKKYKMYKVGTYIYMEEPLYAAQYMCIMSNENFKEGDRVFVVEQDSHVFLMNEEPLLMSNQKCYRTNVCRSDWR